EEGDPEGGGAGRAHGQAEDRQPLRAREGQKDATDRRISGRSRQGTRPAAARRSAGDRMILVIAEQQNGKLNRASWETIVGAQHLAALGSGDGASALSITVLVAGANVG